MDSQFAHAHGTIEKLLAQYERFLEATNAAEKDLVSRFLDQETSRKYITAT